MIGQTISHYQITAKLGAGGMRVILLVERISPNTRIVSKFLSSDVEAIGRADYEMTHRTARPGSRTAWDLKVPSCNVC